MLSEFIKDRVYYKIFDRTYTNSNGVYNKYKNINSDKLLTIEKNLSNIKNSFNSEYLSILNQEHGDNVVEITKDNIDKHYLADASFTKEKNIVLSVFTADCVPVLLTSHDGTIIAAAHCSWKTAKKDIIKTLSEKMLAAGASNIKAIIGPSIQQKSYEVDNIFYQDFIAEDVNNKNLFIKSEKENHYMFDLPEYVQRKLNKENINIISHIDEDTYSLDKKYPSYRRSCHTNTPYSDNILTAIMIR